MDQHEYARTSAAFLRFADEEARDRSALYDELARGTASDPLVIAFLLTLPKEKRQPNLYSRPHASSLGHPPAGASSGTSSGRMRMLFERSC